MRAGLIAVDGCAPMRRTSGSHALHSPLRAVDAFDRLKRLQPHATLADGRNVVDVAQADAQIY